MPSTPAAGSDQRLGRLRPRGAAAAVVLAGGSGTRVGAGRNKVYLPLAGRRVVSCRRESEEAALAHLAPSIDSGDVEVVAIHDGARPLAGPSLWRCVARTAAVVGGAVPALAATGVLPAERLLAAARYRFPTVSRE